jgi:hypothetical protein
MLARDRVTFACEPKVSRLDRGAESYAQVTSVPTFPPRGRVAARPRSEPSDGRTTFQTEVPKRDGTNVDTSDSGVGATVALSGEERDDWNALCDKRETVGLTDEEQVRYVQLLPRACPPPSAEEMAYRRERLRRTDLAAVVAKRMYVGRVSKSRRATSKRWSTHDRRPRSRRATVRARARAPGRRADTDPEPALTEGRP